jgi:hypothetical protein
LLASFAPSLLQALHEPWIAFGSARIVDLHDDEVTPGSADVGYIDEVIPPEAGLCEFSLLSDLAIMDCDDST